MDGTCPILSLATPIFYIPLQVHYGDDLFAQNGAEISGFHGLVIVNIFNNQSWLRVECPYSFRGWTFIWCQIAVHSIVI